MGHHLVPLKYKTPVRRVSNEQIQYEIMMKCRWYFLRWPNWVFDKKMAVITDASQLFCGDIIIFFMLLYLHSIPILAFIAISTLTSITVPFFLVVVLDHHSIRNHWKSIQTSWKLHQFKFLLDQISKYSCLESIFFSMFLRFFHHFATMWGPQDS